MRYSDGWSNFVKKLIGHEGRQTKPSLAPKRRLLDAYRTWSQSEMLPEVANNCGDGPQLSVPSYLR
jgi:hypothetical protein